MNILNLTLNRKWFDMIASGEKTEEYRDIKPYWISRLFKPVKPLKMQGVLVKYKTLDSMYNFSLGYTGNRAAAIEFLLNKGCIREKDFDITSANNGYAKNCPNVKWQHKGIRIGTGRPEWGAEPGKQYFVLEIGELIFPSHTEQITCPECETEQTATVVHSEPWWTYVHRCVKCQYIITESEWNNVNTKTKQS